MPGPLERGLLTLAILAAGCSGPINTPEPSKCKMPDFGPLPVTLTPDSLHPMPTPDPTPERPAGASEIVGQIGEESQYSDLIKQYDLIPHALSYELSPLKRAEEGVTVLYNVCRLLEDHPELRGEPLVTLGLKDTGNTPIDIEEGDTIYEYLKKFLDKLATQQISLVEQTDPEHFQDAYMAFAPNIAFRENQWVQDPSPIYLQKFMRSPVQFDIYFEQNGDYYIGPSSHDIAGILAHEFAHFEQTTQILEDWQKMNNNVSSDQPPNVWYYEQGNPLIQIHNEQARNAVIARIPQPDPNNSEEVAKYDYLVARVHERLLYESQANWLAHRLIHVLEQANGGYMPGVGFWVLNQAKLDLFQSAETDPNRIRQDPHALFHQYVEQGMGALDPRAVLESAGYPYDYKPPVEPESEILQEETDTKDEQVVYVADNWPIGGGTLFDRSKVMNYDLHY